MGIDLNNIPPGEIERFCAKWSIVELSLFGSALRDDFHPGSDIDILVSFHVNAKPTLFHLARMQMELSEILGRKVDLSTKRGIENSRNSIRKQHILSTAQIIYVA